MLIERHVFGSHKGYRCLGCSAGVSKSERAALEVFTFGQTNDRAYLASLTAQPAWLCRPLGPSRRALTRVVAGGDDDAGRVTLRFVSAVFDTPVWIDRGGDVAGLLAREDLWSWDGDARLDAINVTDPPLDMELTPERARILLSILAQLERNYRDGRSVVVRETHVDPALAAWAICLIPDDLKPDVSVGARTLSGQLPLELNVVAECGQIRAGATFLPRPDEPPCCYAAALANAGVVQGKVPWSIIRSYRGFGVCIESLRG